MKVKDGKIISEHHESMIKMRVFKRSTWIPFIKKEITYLIKYKLENGMVIVDDYLSLSVQNRSIDPLNLSSKKGHYLLTRQSMKKFFFKKEDIKKCFKHNISVDTRSRYRGYLHYLPNTFNKSERFIKACLHRAVHSNSSIEWLGRGLHTLQDKFSHYEQNAGIADHALFGKDPDNQEKHPLQFWRAYVASKDYINQYIAVYFRKLNVTDSIRRRDMNHLFEEIELALDANRFKKRKTPLT